MDQLELLWELQRSILTLRISRKSGSGIPERKKLDEKMSIERRRLQAERESRSLRKAEEKERQLSSSQEKIKRQKQGCLR
jgi:hypothetical protein